MNILQIQFSDLWIGAVLVVILFFVVEFYNATIKKKVIIKDVTHLPLPVFHQETSPIVTQAAYQIPFLYLVTFHYQGREHHAFFWELDPNIKAGSEAWAFVRRHPITKFLYVKKMSA